MSRLPNHEHEAEGMHQANHEPDAHSCQHSISLPCRMCSSGMYISLTAVAKAVATRLAHCVLSKMLWQVPQTGSATLRPGHLELAAPGETTLGNTHKTNHHRCNCGNDDVNDCVGQALVTS
jgi:hypothetical protein